MAEKDLKLNDLPRFSKSSPRLVLHEYSNCEVPAGCGGVVFRWKKPDNPVAFEISLYTPGEFKLFIDGEPPQTACTPLERGAHILALILSKFNSNYGILMFVGRTGETGVYTKDIKLYEVDRTERVLSLPDSSWKYLLRPPPDDSWTELQFDDTPWKSLISKELPPIDHEDNSQYSIERLSALGAQSLGPEKTAAEAVWIRKKFSV